MVHYGRMSIALQRDDRFAFDMADRMRRAMRVSEVSVQDMADELEVSRNTIGGWINGHRSPRRRDLKLFAMKTGFPVEWLETGTVGAGGEPNLHTPDYECAGSSRPERLANVVNLRTFRSLRSVSRPFAGYAS